MVGPRRHGGVAAPLIIAAVTGDLAQRHRYGGEEVGQHLAVGHAHAADAKRAELAGGLVDAEVHAHVVPLPGEAHPTPPAVLLPTAFAPQGESGGVDDEMQRRAGRRHRERHRQPGAAGRERGVIGHRQLDA